MQLIWGNDDKLIPAAYAQAWLKQLPKARLLPIPNCGHLPHVERPDEVVRAVKSFSREAAP